MVQLKFVFWVWTFQKASSPVSKLPTDVVTPDKKGAVVQSCHAMPPTALNICDVKRLLFRVLAIIELGEVLNKCKIVQM